MMYLAINATRGNGDRELWIGNGGVDGEVAAQERRMQLDGDGNYASVSAVRSLDADDLAVPASMRGPVVWVDGGGEVHAGDIDAILEELLSE